MNAEDKKTCADLVVGKKEDRLEQLAEMWEAYCDPDNDENYTKDGECLDEFGLSFDYVEADTFDDQPEGFWRYQLSWGGPSDEFRFHDDGRIEYRYHDWWDGAGRDLMGDEYSFMRDFAESYFALVHKQKWEQEW